jgi:hypothetical protein
MPSTEWLATETQRSYQRLTDRLRKDHSIDITRDPETWDRFFQRLEEHFPRLFQLYYHLYASQYDFFYHLQDLVETLARLWVARSPSLRLLGTKTAPGLYLNTRGGIVMLVYEFSWRRLIIFKQTSEDHAHQTDDDRAE